MSVTGQWLAGAIAGQSTASLATATRASGAHMRSASEHVGYPVRSSAWIHAFFDLPLEVALKLEAAARKKTFRRGETIVRRDDPCDQLHMIARGQVKLLLGKKGRMDLLVSVLGEGAYFGEASIIDERPWPISVVALEPTETWVVDRHVVLEVLGQSPEFATEFLFTLTDRLRATFEIVQDAIFLDVAGRLAKKLLNLAEDYGRDTPDGEIIEMPLTQHDLARMVGVTRESVNKHLGAFRARGIIDVQDRRIRICRPQELRRRIY